MTPHDAQDRATPPDPSRRGFLGIAGAVVAALGGMIGIPVGQLAAAPAFGRKTAADGAWVPIGPADEFGEGRVEKEYSYQHQDGWYTATRTRRVLVGRQKEGDGFVVLSTKCTHVGCGVTWLPEEQKFLCPCHGGEFDAEGAPIKPPVTEPLARLETRVNEATGQLEVKES